MSHRYEPVTHREEDDDDLEVHGSSTVDIPHAPIPIPSSPPPSFHSLQSPPQSNTALADSFDSPDSDDDDDDSHDMRNTNTGSTNANFQQQQQQHQESAPLVPQRGGVASNLSRFLPSWGSSNHSNRVVGGGQQADGVFANLSAKPSVGEKLEEFPPTYEQAAADATPPYWETTILAPGLESDEVYIDGLPVGSVFAFVWNMLISMAFQVVGFLLTYLLHTTHAAKNGSRAGLGITFIQFGFVMRGQPEGESGDSNGDATETEPANPNSYDFQGAPESVTDGADQIGRNEWLSYVLMIAGWFILIRAVSDYLRARRTEQVVLASPDRGLGVAVISEGEDPARAV